jgi:hypothetical protein
LSIVEPRREQWVAGGRTHPWDIFMRSPSSSSGGTRKTSNGGNLFRLSVIGQSARKTGNNAGKPIHGYR